CTYASGGGSASPAREPVNSPHDHAVGGNTETPRHLIQAALNRRFLNVSKPLRSNSRTGISGAEQTYTARIKGHAIFARVPPNDRPQLKKSRVEAPSRTFCRHCRTTMSGARASPFP